MSQLFPAGLGHYIAGGAMVGVAIGLVYLLTGRIAGVSSYFTAVQSWWSRVPFFQKPETRDDRDWKSLLVIGLVLGAALTALIQGEAFVTGVQWWRLLIGGLLVGIGTRTARGCTSGHGICGVSALAAPSILATVVFMSVAIVTARLVAMTGVTP